MKFSPTGAIVTVPDVEIVDTVLAVSSRKALDMIVISAEELVTSPDDEAPSDRALAVLQLIWPLVVKVIDPTRETMFASFKDIPAFVAALTVAEMLIPPPLVAIEAMLVEEPSTP